MSRLNWQAARCAILCAVVLIDTASAHHSNAPHYDNSKPVTIEGVVREFEFVNPHAFLHIDVMADDGGVATWECELPTANTLRRRGWTATQFVPGQRITVNGIAARRNATGCSFNSAVLSDGTRIERAGPGVQNVDVPAIARTDISNLAGVWMRDTSRRQQGPGPGSRLPGAELLTPLGLEAQANYDQRFDDPSFECSSSSITRSWSAPGTPTEIEIGEDQITIRHEFMDTVRSVRLSRTHASGLSPRPFGHSIGWHEDSTLVIDTVGFEPGVLTPHPGILHSDQLHIVERISPGPEGETMQVDWVAEDSRFFHTPLTGTFYFVPSPFAVQAFACTPEHANR